MIILCTHPTGKQEKFVYESRTITIARMQALRADYLNLDQDGKVSRIHARLTEENGAYWIEDLQSENGTWVNNQRITTKTQLKANDVIRVGQTRLVVEMPEQTPRDQIIADTLPAGMETEWIDARRPPFASSDATQAQRHLQAFYDFSQSLGKTITPAQVLQVLKDNLQRAIPPVQRGAVLLWNQHGQPLLKLNWPAGSPHAVSMTWAEQTRVKREAVIWPKTERVDSNKPDSAIKYNVQSAIYVPMLWEEQAIGVLCVDNHEQSEAFTLADADLLRAIANQAALFIKNHELQREAARQAEIKARLLRRFPDAVAEQWEREAGLFRVGGQSTQPVTVLFSDVRGFVRLGATLKPQQVAQMLNDMFFEFVRIVKRYNGSVDKYIGDAIMAVFGCPQRDENQWANAVRAAWQMREVWQTVLLPRWDWLTEPEKTGIGIGIHTGEVWHGFVGAEEYIDYTVVGDVVNAASRYCDGAKRGEVIISPEVYESMFARVEAHATTIPTKHDGDWPAYVVTRLR